MQIARLIAEAVGWVAIGVAVLWSAFMLCNTAARWLFVFCILGPAHRQERLRHLILSDLAVQYRGQSAGSECRKRIVADGFECSGVEFYQAAAWLETAGRVVGWYEQEIIDGQPIKERWLQIK